MKTRLLVWWENKGARVNCIPTGGSSIAVNTPTPRFLVQKNNVACLWPMNCLLNIDP